MKYKTNTIETFHTKYIVDVESGCWIWQGKLDKDGYGTFCSNYIHWRAHRYAYVHIKEPINKDLQIDHLCRNRACVNPDHLEPVTCRENLMRGNTYAALASKKTHCKYGHEFTVDNTYIAKNNTRKCKQCDRTNALKRYHARNN